MTDKNSSRNSNQEESAHSRIPDLDIIDLDKEFSEPGEDTASDRTSSEEFEEAYNRQKTHNNRIQPKKSGNFLSRINVHIVLLVVAVIFVAGIVYKIATFGVRIDRDDINKIEDDENYLALRNAFDSIIPLVDENGEYIIKDYGEGTNILVFGNAPFADDRDSEDSLAHIIEDMTGANVYNCAISGSYLAAIKPSIVYVQDAPLDAFNFYWLCTIATCDLIDNAYRVAVELLGEDAPPEAMDVFNTLKTIDYSTIDVIAIMYDGSDYLAGHEMYNDSNAEDILQFNGNMVAGVNLLKAHYPNIRIIVMSPTYAFAIDENGDYISSDVQRYGQDVLSTYSIKQYGYCYDNLNVTFIDNLYGTITEDNAPDYLIDNIHLNVEGRKKVAERFVYALQFYNEKDS